MRKVIVTGFKSFGGYTVNPTEVLAESIHNQIISGFQVHSLVFSTHVLNPDGFKNPDLDRIKAVIKAGVAGIISLGLASIVQGLRIEERSINWIENDKYCAPHEKCQPIDSNKPVKEIKRIDLSLWQIKEIMQGWQNAGVPFEEVISNDAGNFCCNALIYRILYYLEELNLKIPFLYLHVPCTEDSVKDYQNFDRTNKIFIEQAMLVRVIEVILNSLVKH